MCATCNDSAVTGRDVCTGRLVRKIVRLSVHRCGEGAWLSLYTLYVSPRSPLTVACLLGRTCTFLLCVGGVPQELAVLALGCNLY